MLKKHHATDWISSDHGMVSFSFVPVTPAYAESELVLRPRAPGLNAAFRQIMTNVFHEEQNWLLIQQNNLGEANLLLAQLNRLIQAPQAEGNNVSSTLTGALTPGAMSSHNTSVSAYQPLRNAHIRT